MSKYRDKEVENIAGMLKALSNPNRLKIFLRLISCCRPGTIAGIDTTGSNGCACVGELGLDLNLAPSTISHHIKELRQAGLIHMKRRGQKIECWVKPEALEYIKSFFEQ